MIRAAQAPVAPEVGTQAVQGIARFMQDFSIEATRPTLAEIVALKDLLPAGTRVYLSSVPRLTEDEVVNDSARLREAGFEPVPHIAGREFASGQVLSRLLRRLRADAAIRCALVLAGDRTDAAGPFTAAVEVIESGLLQEHGIAEIGISAYPEGSPAIADHELRRLMRAKIAAAEDTALRVHIVTQFGFDARRIAAWVDQLRNDGIDHPVRIGLAGPARLSTLLKYAQRCGVRTSAQGIVRMGGMAKHLLGQAAPDALIRSLSSAAAAGKLGQIAPHLFSFGGITATARWAASAARGELVLVHDGFSVSSH